MDYREIEPRLSGMWEEIFISYGIELPQWQGKNTKNGPCCLCGGDDRAHFRMTDGRISLYCRSCAAEQMKSPEDVLMEFTGLSFPELVRELAQFAGCVDDVQVTRAQNKAKAAPRRNMPVGHKQDHDASIKFLNSCGASDKFNIFNSLRIQHPSTLPDKGGYPILPVVNEVGSVVNCACISRKGLSFLAGGFSYGAWHVIPQCETRKTEGIAWCTSVVRGLHHYWKTGQETRIVFDVFNMIWMLNVGLIDESRHTLVVEEKEKSQLP